MERDWEFVRAVAGKDFTKSLASMSVVGSVGYAASFYQDRTSDTHHH